MSTPSTPTLLSPLALALRMRDGAALEAALAQGADPHERLTGLPGTTESSRPLHPLRYFIATMAYSGEHDTDLALMATLLRHGVDPNIAPDRIEGHQHRPLMMAVMHALPQTTQLLLAFGADVDLPAQDHGTLAQERPIHGLAWAHGPYDALMTIGEALLHAGASLDDVRNHRSFTPLQMALQEANLHAIPVLLALRPLSLEEGREICHLLADPHSSAARLRLPSPDTEAGHTATQLLVEALAPLMASDTAFRTTARAALQTYATALRTPSPTTSAWMESFLSQEQIRHTLADAPTHAASSRRL